MSENLLIIDKKVLPDVFEKVINVKKIFEIKDNLYNILQKIHI